MSAHQSAISAIQAYYLAFNSKNWQGMLDRLANNIRHDLNEGEARYGKEKFAEFLTHMDTCYEETLTDMVIMANGDGTRGAAEFIVNGTYRKTDGNLPEAHGQEYRLPAGAFFELEKGLISRVTTYYNLANWMAEVSRTKG